jgi:hypothetical protein
MVARRRYGLDWLNLRVDVLLKSNDAHVEAMYELVLVKCGSVMDLGRSRDWCGFHVTTITKNRATPLKRLPGFSGSQWRMVCEVTLPSEGCP